MMEELVLFQLSDLYIQSVLALLDDLKNQKYEKKKERLGFVKRPVWHFIKSHLCNFEIMDEIKLEQCLKLIYVCVFVCVCQDLCFLLVQFIVLCTYDFHFPVVRHCASVCFSSSPLTFLFFFWCNVFSVSMPAFSLLSNLLDSSCVLLSGSGSP